MNFMQIHKHCTKGLFLLFFFSFIALFFCSCGPQKAPRFEIGDSFYYWEADADSTLGDALQNARNFKKLEDKSAYNLRNVLGKGSHYVWVRAEFEIPQELRHKPVGLVIPHLRFAEQLYCNNVFISQYGNFPPNEQSTLFKAHFFSFPLDILRQDGKNTVLIKIYAHGRSGISSHAFIQHTGLAHANFEIINFHNTRSYIFLFGIFIFTFILYTCFYLGMKDFREFRDFALLNIFTAIFLLPFFATELPAYANGNIPYIPFIKLTLCIPPYIIIYFATLFVIDYTKRRFSKKYVIARAIILATQLAVTIFAPNYDFLIKITPFMLILLTMQGIIGAWVVVTGLIEKNTRKQSVQLLIGFSPFSIGGLTDIFLRFHDTSRTYPYFSIFGWALAIAVFIVLLAIRFSQIYLKNVQLSNHLLEEVSNRTHDLQDANKELSLLNERLEKEKKRADMDLDMASIVQRKFLPKPNRHFRGWEIATCYSPQSKVSGDFYDYYSFNDTLNGITLFDVSGHGLSASLVTMLSKNIISRVFQTGFRRKERVDIILNKINNLILAEKGEIENYMTGVLCRFDDSEEPGKCNAELGNAGHPYPLKYSLKDNEVFELKGNDGKQHYGAIGMQGITVSFARSNFIMSTGDILVFYTDGLTEASNQNQEQFGIESVKEIIKANHAKSAGEILGLIVDELERFTEYRGIEDDLSLIIAKRKNTGEYVADDEHDDLFDDTIEELEEVDEPLDSEDSTPADFQDED